MLPSLAFFVAALILAVTPGPGIAYVVARTAAGSRGEGLASCVGTGLGGMLHVGAAALGLSVLLAQSAVAFTVVKFIGAAYLIYLGIRLLLAKAAATPVQSGRPACAALCWKAILVEALNVKTALFFLAFLPQFLVSGPSVVMQLVVMGTVCVVLNTLVDVAAYWGLSACSSRRQRAGSARDCSTRRRGSHSSVWGCMWPGRSKARDGGIARECKVDLR
jgi:threonine/homoserine/homoserine lactone efflux protein